MEIFYYACLHLSLFFSYLFIYLFFFFVNSFSFYIPNVIIKCEKVAA